MSNVSNGPSDGASRPSVVDEFDGGVGWIAHPDERMRRTSHALQSDGEVWVVDPVDAPGLDDLLAERGEVSGVVVLLDRHTRDADAIARRHDVSVYLPTPLGGTAGDVDAPVELFEEELADTGYRAHPVVDRLGWREVALHEPDAGVLVVPEAIGTAEFFTVGPERVGVHPALRLRPPQSLGRFDPERLLVGHGAGIHDDAPAALRTALDGARRRTPRLYWRTLRSLLSG